MKRHFKYIIIFLIVCISLLGVSTLTEKTIITYYSGDVVDELYDTFTTKDNFIINGNMMAIFLHGSGTDFTLDGNFYSGFKGEEQYKQVKDSNYTVQIDRTTYDTKYNITKTVSNNIIKLDSILNLNKTLFYKNLVINMIYIISVILMYYAYIKRSPDKKKIVNKTLNFVGLSIG